MSEYLFTKDAEFRLNDDNKKEKQATTPTCAVGEYTKQNNVVGHDQEWLEL